MEFELANYDSAIHRFNHFTPQIILCILRNIDYIQPGEDSQDKKKRYIFS